MSSDTALIPGPPAGTLAPMSSLVPNCAICNAPPQAQCPCESDGLRIAVQQAEKRIMEPMLDKIRDWVIEHARQYVLQTFSAISAARKQQHASYLASLHNNPAYFPFGGPHPSQMAQMEIELKRGIDEDWRHTIQTYPDVLNYFYNLVELTLPSDNSPTVAEPSVGSHPQPEVPPQQPPQQEPSTPPRQPGRGSLNPEAAPGSEERRRQRRRRYSVGRETTTIPTAPPPPATKRTARDSNRVYGW
ncbi:hypothetical protein L228DRAFT_265623 [Xylona heveae TC161]|uniref:Uncharacterized protein n=1 Tax=Xylona heveae (strain CBS 132557 / TC161) TaxID=1328760 RepID=A0A165INC7_XYLHT|nr:hypothetical protein L228DRAFT_265623 [Xylona heveae TC161]KZF25149.1 hypothetical protein L228DRAFT_265623 [Xylona heveae TC161]